LRISSASDDASPSQGFIGDLADTWAAGTEVYERRSSSANRRTVRMRERRELARQRVDKTALDRFGLNIGS
jgi:hypothetical protein